MKVSAAEQRERQLFVAAFMSIFPISNTAVERTCWRAFRKLSNETRSGLLTALIAASPYAQRVATRMGAAE